MECKADSSGRGWLTWAFVALLVGQIAGCNRVNSTAESRSQARFMDYVCTGFWPLCMAYDSAYEYAGERLKRNAAGAGQ